MTTLPPSAAQLPPDPRHVMVIEAGHHEKQYWHDLWRFRDLFYILAWRDIAVRYKQTIIGVSWTVLQPLLSLVVLSLLFGRLAKMPSGGAPYPLLVFAALLPWQFFSSALGQAGQSVLVNGQLISKVYFPRLIIPTAAIVTAMVDFLVNGVLLVALLAWYRTVPGWPILALPFFLVLAFLTALGPSLLFTALSVRYRDFRIVTPFIIQFGLFVSPVAYSSTLVPPAWQPVYALNPMVGVIEGFRWMLLGAHHTLNVPMLLVSISVCAIFLVVGLAVFRRTERDFADLI